MKLLVVVLLTLLTSSAELLFYEAQSGVPPVAYKVPILGLRTTAMSPDEKYLAAVVLKSGAAEVQLWDFRNDSLLRSHSLPAPKPSDSGYPEKATYLRYTSDGELLTAYTGGDSLYILRATNLDEVRTIRIRSRSAVTGLEVSPHGYHVAIATSGDVSIYELDSGAEIRNWAIPQHPHFEISALLKVDPELSGLSWHDDGTTLAVSAADNHPCFRGGGTIYILDLTEPNPTRSFRVGLLPSAVAFGRVDSLYVASNTCGGYFSHWTLDLSVFDSKSGRQISKIPAGKVGIRNHMVISANRLYLLAYADREKMTFEGFEDTLKIEDPQWQVWDLTTRQLVLTLPARSPGGGCGYDALSTSGRFVYGGRAWEACIIPVLPGRK